MSEESPSSTALGLHRLFTIRLSPPLVNRLSPRTQQADSSLGKIHGLLFGLFYEGLLSVQAFRSFGENGDSIDGRIDPRQQDELFEQLLTTARQDSEISSLELVGWYTVRADGGLLQSDVQFHDCHFKRPGDIALVLKPEGNTHILWELYCRSADGGFSDKAHRWGAVRLAHGSPLVNPIEVTMRAKIQDDFFMRAYEATGLENQLPLWKKVVRGPLPRQKQSSPKPATAVAPQQLAPGTLPKSETSSLQKAYAGPPMNVPALVPGTSARKRAPWLSLAVIFAMAAGLTFSLVYNGGLFSRDNLPESLKSLFSAPKLGLRLESQGDRILLTWNRRHPAVHSAKGGVLQIDDGMQHRQVNLDAAQVSNGSVLYRPNSDDVTFRLEVEGAQGGKVSESMRVLEAAKPSILDLSTPAPNSTVSRTIEPLGQVNSAGHNSVVGQALGMTTPKSMPSIAQKPGAAIANNIAVDSSMRSRQSDYSQGAQLPPAQKPLEIPRSQNTDAGGHVASDALPPAPVQTGKSQPVASTTSSPAPGTAARPAEVIQSPPPPEIDIVSPPATEKQNLVLPPSSTPPINLPPPAVRPAQSVPSSSYRAPHPLRQVLPNVALLAPTVAAAAGRVEVVVKVDERGRVTGAHLADGTKKINAGLAGASITAAKQWTFEPAMLNGKAVPSQHSIVFQFQSSK